MQPSSNEQSVPSQAELQKRAATLMAELHGVMTQMQTVKSGTTSVQKPDVDSPRKDANSPFNAFPVPGVPTTTTHPSTSTLDQDLARLLPGPNANSASSSAGTATGARGNSPPMDPEKWMTSMLSSMASMSSGSTASAPNTGGVGVSAPVEREGFTVGASNNHQAQHQQHYHHHHHGGYYYGGGRRGRMVGHHHHHYGGSQNYPAPEFYPHGRGSTYYGGFDPSAHPFVPGYAEDSYDGGARGGYHGQTRAQPPTHTVPEKPKAAVTPAATTANVIAPAKETAAPVVVETAKPTSPPPAEPAPAPTPATTKPSATSAASGTTTTKPEVNAPASSSSSTSTNQFKPNLAAKPFRPPQPSIGAPIHFESAHQIIHEAFGDDFPLLTDIAAPAQPQATPAVVEATPGKPKKLIPPKKKVDDDDCLDTDWPMAYVEFKRQRIKKFPSQGVIQPGQYVIVDGDRGQDCGLLIQMTAPTKDGRLSVLTMEGSSFDDQKLKPERGKVIRVAEAHEIDMLHNEIAAAEKVALDACRVRCKELRLGIEVLDCEYQFDMKKISFYFDSDRSVDFRDLVRDLYRAFGARIWMENINPNVKNIIPIHLSRRN